MTYSIHGYLPRSSRMLRLESGMVPPLSRPFAHALCQPSNSRYNNSKCTLHANVYFPLVCQSIEERKYKKIFSAEKSFDESGGRIFADADAIVLSILPGALKAKTSIVISILSSCDGSEKSTIIELRPHLMAFSQSALLRVSHHASKVAICYAKDVGPYEFIGHVAEDHPRCESETMNISFNKFYIDMQMMSFCRICVTEHSSSFPASLLFFLPKSMSSAVGVTTCT